MVAMLAKLARWRFAGRLGGLGAPGILAPCNDNYPLRRLCGDRKQRPRHVLVCHWRVQPLTGALECEWQPELSDDQAGAAADEDPRLLLLIATG
jgi:hypothetical protein